MDKIVVFYSFTYCSLPKYLIFVSIFPFFSFLICSIFLGLFFLHRFVYESLYCSSEIKGNRANADFWTPVAYFYGINRIGFLCLFCQLFCIFVGIFVLIFDNGYIIEISVDCNHLNQEYTHVAATNRNTQRP